MTKDELTKYEKDKQIKRMMIDPEVICEYIDPDEVKKKEPEVKQPQLPPVKAVNPINPNFVFPQYDSRDARSLHKFMESARQYQQEQENSKCSCKCCKCGR